MAAKYPIASLGGGKTLWSDGSVTSTSTTPPTATPTPYPTNPANANPFIKQGTVGAPVAVGAKPIASTKSVLGTTNVKFDNGTEVPSSSVSVTQGSTPQGGGSTGGAPTDNNNLGDNAKAGLDAELEAIKSSLSAIAGVAQKSIDRARGVRDELVSNIGTTYGGLRTAAAGKSDASLENLTQEDIGVQNTYGRAQGTARRAMDSALAKNRMLARATNRMDSSFYDDRQAGTTEGTARSIADLQGEAAGKRAGIGTRKTETNNWYNQTDVTLGQEEAQLKSQADRDLQDQVDQANYMEQNFNIDATLKKQQAVNEYQSKLDGINNYILSKATTEGTIANKAATQKGSINSYEAINPTLQSILAKTTGLQGAEKTANEITDTSGVVNPTVATDPTQFIRNKASTYEEELRKLGILLS
jgi:hypothetical protein